MTSTLSRKATKIDGAISTLGPSGTDSANEARKLSSTVLLFPSFVAAVENARKTNGYALVPTGYLDILDGMLADSWVDMHFRLLGQMRIVEVWESPTKAMCLAINLDRVPDRASIRSVASHPATAVFARQTCADAEITFVTSKPLAVEAAASGRVDACIGSVDVVAEFPLEPLDHFHPTMVWTLYRSFDEPAEPDAPTARSGVMYPDWVRKLPQVKTPFPGAAGWLMSSPHGQVVLWEFQDGATVHPHRHGPQLGFVLAGRTVMDIEGVTKEWLAGETFAIGDQEEHSAVVDPGTYIIEIFDESDRHKAM